MASKNGKKRGNQPLGSVDAFWADYPRLHFAKQIFDGAVELIFLVEAARAFHNDRDKICEDTQWNENFNMERIRVCLNLMVFIHTLHLCRLLFQVYNKYNSKSGACKGCLRCLLLDCYCCAGTAVYLYTQIVWLSEIGECREELPYIKAHMRHEIIYQYCRVCWYFVSNLMVVLFIIHTQRNFERRMNKEYQVFSQHVRAKSEKLSTQLKSKVKDRLMERNNQIIQAEVEKQNKLGQSDSDTEMALFNQGDPLPSPVSGHPSPAMQNEIILKLDSSPQPKKSILKKNTAYHNSQSMRSIKFTNESLPSEETTQQPKVGQQSRQQNGSLQARQPKMTETLGSMGEGPHQSIPSLGSSETGGVAPINFVSPRNILNGRNLDNSVPNQSASLLRRGQNQSHQPGSRS